jgi:glycosyltransferase involved in cell wall biosynthesis
MRIAFLLTGNVSRNGNLTGYNIRYGGASSSGTESSVIYIAEYLSSIGHKTTIALEKCDEPINSNGVSYTDFNFSGESDLEYDILISCLWFKDYELLPIKVNKALIYWCHLAWGYSYGEMVNYVNKNNLKFGLVSISNWAYNHNIDIKNIMENSGVEVFDVVIPNPVAVDIMGETLKNPPVRNPHRFIHHGQWSRGGDTAFRSIKSLNWEDYEFISFDYIDTVNGLDKSTLFNAIAASEYFVYPQITHGKWVYKDTFSVSIAEAIGLGAIVVTYPLGAVPEYFGDYCQFLEYPEGVNIERLKSERLSEEPLLDCTDNIVEMIKYLEDNPDHKEKIRQAGKKYIADNFNIDKVGSIWKEYLKVF